MYVIFAYDYENRKMAVPAAFEEELDAWDTIAELMKQPNHPKMAWVAKGVFDEYIDINCDRRSQP